MLDARTSPNPEIGDAPRAVPLSAATVAQCPDTDATSDRAAHREEVRRSVRHDAPPAYGKQHRRATEAQQHGGRWLGNRCGHEVPDRQGLVAA